MKITKFACLFEFFETMTLDNMQEGQFGRIVSVGAEGAFRQHLLDMGLIPGLKAGILRFAPMGDPVEVLVQGYSLTLRKADAALISVQLDEDTLTPSPVSGTTAPTASAAAPGTASGTASATASGTASGTAPGTAPGTAYATASAAAQTDSETDLDPSFGYDLSLHEHNAHPGLGESGKYHSKDHAPVIPKGSTIKIALVGQQNSGKTTLFNALTGSTQHVGNFPGVTVERKDAALKGHPEAIMTDLPGVYSLSACAAEEMVARDHILNEHPDCIINVVDAGNIERNLYLTVQLMELGIPVVLALNMMDELRGNGGMIRLNEMERVLGIPVVPVSGAKKEGISELVDHALHIATFKEVPARQDFCSRNDYGGAVHRCVHSIMHLIEAHCTEAGLPLRFAASRVVDGDRTIIDRLGLSAEEQAAIESIIATMERERGLDRNAAMADMRYTFIRRLCHRTVVRPKESREYRRSQKMDRILTGKWTGIPIFVAIISLVLWLSIDVIGAKLQELLGAGIEALATLTGSGLDALNVSPAVRSLVVDAIFGGVGSVISFIPVILVLFFFLSLLEDSGYMARVAFITDKLLRKAGLSGRSIVPMLIGLGCSVPAVMAARTLPSALDRKKTIMLIPFMSCSAKIPVYAFLSSAFFPGRGGLVLICLYITGILTGTVVALIRKWVNKLAGKDTEASPFVMELPNYRLPQLKNLSHLLWDKTRDYIQMAFTVIFVATIVIWFLQSFNFRFRMVPDGDGSMLSIVAGVIAPLFNPLGLGDWRIITALISGFLAKESIVSSLQVLGAVSLMNEVTAVPMLVFCLLYTPCVAAVAAVRAELGTKWAIYMSAFQCIVAWICAYVAHLAAMIIF